MSKLRRETKILLENAAVYRKYPSKTWSMKPIRIRNIMRKRKIMKEESEAIVTTDRIIYLYTPITMHEYTEIWNIMKESN